ALGAVVGTEDDIPKRARLDRVRNYPNPFSDVTTVALELVEGARTIVTVHDVMGRLICTLVDDELGPGEHRITWDGKNGQHVRVADGIYFIRLETDQGQTVRKVVQVR
ncbi:MAG: T9SS type A sorting domain-containing protein, partial [Rhodothermales bacterium]